VYGEIRDARGRPVAGVELVAHCGVGTLRPTSRTTTALDGRYRLKFGISNRFMRRYPPARPPHILPAETEEHRARERHVVDSGLAARPRSGGA
jgi:hypothetical protein